MRKISKNLLNIWRYPRLKVGETALPHSTYQAASDIKRAEMAGISRAFHGTEEEMRPPCPKRVWSGEGTPGGRGCTLYSTMQTSLAQDACTGRTWRGG